MRNIGLLLKVLWAPGEAMFLLSKNPSVIVPIVFVMLVSFGSGMLVLSKLSPADLAIRAIERSPQAANFSDEQKEQMRQRMNSPAVQVISMISTALGPIILLLVVTLVYFGVFTVLGREGTFKAFFSITAFAFVPMIFRQLATVLSVYVVPASSIMPDELGSLSPAVFLDRDSVSRGLFAAVNMIDVVSIWILCLLVIGFGFVTRKNLGKAARAATVFGIFLLYACVRVLLAQARGF